MEKEDVVYLYSGILLSHKKEWNKAIWPNKDIPRDYQMKWSKSERERLNVLWYSLCVEWNIYENSNIYVTETLRDIENKLIVTKEDG